MRGPDPKARHRASRHVDDETPATNPTDRTPAWILAPHAVRIPFLTDPPQYYA
ncbi:hypothetical protein [Modicisalibacter muralis]|uniref:hypothetical protein n=1 Tax=Modicisalibacter muralis TaxID=119000 RepID=UPI0015873902|nr:hypothetical protein [Halomonas muralis]